MVQLFITDVLKSNPLPIGEIVDFFYRVKFQQRDHHKVGFKITKKNGWSFLKLRIQSSHQRIKQLDKQCSNLVRKLLLIISQEHFDTLSKVISHNASKLKEKVRNTHS